MKAATQTQSVFDQSHYLRLIEARGETIRRVVSELKPVLGLSTALDAGCGVGHFSVLLKDLGFQVTGLDARQENVEEARRRCPGVAFETADVEDLDVDKLGRFDLVLAVGLLYHLENPFRGIRNLRRLTDKILVVESMCIDEELPVLHLRDEGPTEDQGLHHVAFYPSEAGLVKMLYRAGFPAVYRFTRLPEHVDFRASFSRRKARTILLAASVPIHSADLALVPEPVAAADPWATAWAIAMQPLQRLGHFLVKPLPEKVRSVGFRWLRLFPRAVFPMRLPFGAWWLARNDFCGLAVLNGGFEKIECRFVERLLRPGMTAVDIGAHHGLYTLLASRKVGPRGRVIAFEPSPRERKHLLRHLRLNRCRNVRVEEVALGSRAGEAELFLVEGIETGCNSLRPPNVNEPTRTVHVPVRTLDECLERQGIGQVDFVKLDVEGAELEVLGGARILLQRRPRPVILAEVQDLRTEPWGYPAKEIIAFLQDRGYRWYRLVEHGDLRPLEETYERFNGNLVAVPEERVQSVGAEPLTSNVSENE